MRQIEWRRLRSQFNHAWLKNRFIVTLGKARRVAEGAVKDDMIWDDLSAILAEWPARRRQAEKILDKYPEAAEPTNSLTTSGASAYREPEIVSWLAEVANKRWMSAEMAEGKSLEARKAINTFDLRIQILNKALSDFTKRKNKKDMLTILVELQVAAIILSESFSILGSASSKH